MLESIKKCAEEIKRRYYKQVGEDGSVTGSALTEVCEEEILRYHISSVVVTKHEIKESGNYVCEDSGCGGNATFEYEVSYPFKASTFRCEEHLMDFTKETVDA